MSKKLKWIDKYLEVVIISALIVAITALLTVQIFSRKFFSYSFSWSEQLCCHMLICIGLFGVPCSIRAGNAICFDIITTFLPAKAKHIFAIIADAIMVVFFVYIIPSAVEVVKSQATTSAKVLPYTMDVIYGICLGAIVLLIVRLVQGIVLNAAELKKKDKHKVCKESGEGGDE